MPNNLQDDPTRRPPGQALTRKFPVVGEQAPPPEALDLDAFRLTVEGLVEKPFELTWQQVMDLPQEERVVDIHCVTGWSHLGMRLGGFPLTTLLDRARPLPEARFVRFEASSDRNHDTSLPLDLALEDTWLIHSRDGEPLEPAHGYPLRTVTPSRYFYKSLKWVRRIELMAEDQLGFWERESSYHNNADPWPGDERFTSGSIKPDRLERLRQAEDFKRYRGKVFLGLDLEGWQPGSQDLSGMEFKNCNLRGAQLAGCDFRRANLSLSNLSGANLSGADLSDADLEGADFRGANLEGANIERSLLSATRFYQPGGEAGLEAQVKGLRFEDCRGLLEDQEAFLKRNT